MMDEKFKIDSYLRTAQEKYIYFLLTASASAIAFSISQTRTEALAWSQLPLAMAILCWAFSFYFGCKSTSYFQELQQDSAYLYEMDDAMNDMPETKEQILEILGNSYSENLVATKGSHKKQFLLLISGGIFFIGWHVTEMVLRTINAT